MGNGEHVTKVYVFQQLLNRTSAWKNQQCPQPLLQNALGTIITTSHWFENSSIHIVYKYCRCITSASELFSWTMPVMVKTT